MTAAQWYVLIEEDTRMTKHADGVELKLHHWTLVASHPVGGSEEDALGGRRGGRPEARSGPAGASRQAGGRAGPPGVPRGGRLLAGLAAAAPPRVPPAVTTARLVHVVEGNDAPPKTFRDRLRNALDGPAPEPTRWAPGA
ncbi:hypothetical protein GCM10020229_17290 [Kitasatospora albolonga]|uniref:hypothetical protein n=1 Tax=Kitasatospora albolonga TaxID=68173 RepID=UPI0031F0B440